MYCSREYQLTSRCQSHLYTLQGNAMRFRRTAGADSDVTPLNYLPRYWGIQAYNWDQILNLQTVPFQMWTFLRQPGQSSRIL